MPLLGKYKYIIDKTHPKANSEGCVYLHIIIAEEKLGRHLLPKEVVHHKDFDKLNNDVNNLMIFATKSDHTRFHMNGCDDSTLSLNANGVYICRSVLQKYKNFCIDCGKEISKRSTRCKECTIKHSCKVDRPNRDELFNILLEHKGNFTKIGKHYGVSDNAVRKWCDSYSLSRKSKDYKQCV